MQPRVVRTWALQLLWLVLPVAALLAAYLGYAQIRLTHGVGSFQSICVLSETFDCDAVVSSRYSEIYGIPISFFALPIYGAMLFLVNLATIESVRGRKARRALSTLAYWIVGVSGFLAWESWTELGVWCLFCLGLYAVHLLAFLLVLLPPGGRLPGLPAGREFVWAATIATTMLLSLWLGSSFSGAQLDQMAMVDMGLASAGPSAVRMQIEERPGGKVKLSTVLGDAPPAEHNPSLGNADADVVVVEFGDFDCGHCRKLRSTLASLEEKYAEQVRFVFKHFPLDQACNPHVERTHHPRACEAAYAAQCAQHQGAFWSYQELLVKNQKFLDDEDLQHFAETLDLDLSDFEACRKGSAVRQEILEDVSLGADLELGGIPRTYVNRRQFRGAVSTAILDAAIRVELGQVELDAEGRVETRREIVVGTPLVTGSTDMVHVQSGSLDFWMDAVEGGLSSQGEAASVAGNSPAMASWLTAENACSRSGKRMCSQEEWLSACSGSQPVDRNGDGLFVGDYHEGRMYPYGEHYMGGVCWDSGDQDMNGVLPTGKRGACRSPEGVYDLVGNIQEWVGLTRETAVLMGGGWYSQERANCGSSEDRFGVGYQNRSTGFRCCADGQVAGARVIASESDGMGVEVGMMLPEFSGFDLMGQPLSSDLMDSQVGLVHFWASWCVPCQRELAFLARLQRELGSGLRVMSVNVDRNSDEARPIMARLQLPFPVLMDTESEVLGLFDALDMPMSVLVGTDGRVLELHAGFSDGWAKETRTRVTELLEAE